MYNFAIEFWSVVVQMAPYLLFGFLVAGILYILIPAATVEKHLGGRGIFPVIKASLFGVPLPLCSCGVIPVAASLHKHGASKGATVAFLLSTPETGIDSMFVTYSLLGPVFGIVRPIAAFLTGVIGGAAVDFTEHNGPACPLEPLPKLPKKTCTGTCCTAHHSRSHKIRKGLSFGFRTLPQDIGGPMLIGVFIAAIISIVVPEDFFAPVLGGGIISMLIMMAVGIPMYVCASASVPIAAALIAKGVSPGAAWVFLMTGPASNAASIAIIWATLGHKTTITYLVSLAACALTSGILLDMFITSTAVTEITHHHTEMLSPWIAQPLAVILILVLTYGMFLKYFRKHSPSHKA